MGEVTYDPSVIRAAAIGNANKVKAKLEADALYQRTYERALASKPRKARRTVKKKVVHRRKAKTTRRRGGGGVGNFLNAFGNWSRNTQNNLFDGNY